MWEPITAPCSLQPPSSHHKFLFHIKQSAALEGFLWLIGALGSAGTVRTFYILRSGLSSAEVLWSARGKFLNIIHAQHLNTFGAPDALIYPGSPETTAYNDSPVLTQDLGCWIFRPFYPLAPYNHIQTPHIFDRVVQSLCFSLCFKISLFIRASL